MLLHPLNLHNILFFVTPDSSFTQLREIADPFTFCLLRTVQFFQSSSRTWLLVPMTAVLNPHRGHTHR